MAGIYIHIPFCKKKCSYCDFHFSTSLKKKSEMILALKRELYLRKDEINEPIETIYFGGGTPSLCTTKELQDLLDVITKNYPLTNTVELTLEVNPDDLSKEKIKEIYALGFNRLSIGVQSFFDSDLVLMNRSHTAKQSLTVIENAQPFFDNISIDLIYGIPNVTQQGWKNNIDFALKLGVPHISSYALTVERKTALEHWVQHKEILMPKDEHVHQQFLLLIELLEAHNFVHYELSNFGKQNYFSKNNTAYWLGKKYLGIGPSAHSFNGLQRSWNIANNTKYIQSLHTDNLPSEIETLSITDRYNEYIMTGLRTIWGVSLEKITQDFGEKYKSYLLKTAQKFINLEQLTLEQNILKTTLKGKFLIDGIAAELFYL